MPSLGFRRLKNFLSYAHSGDQTREREHAGASADNTIRFMVYFWDYVRDGAGDGASYGVGNGDNVCVKRVRQASCSV